MKYYLITICKAAIVNGSSADLLNNHLAGLAPTSKNRFD